MVKRKKGDGCEGERSLPFFLGQPQGGPKAGVKPLAKGEKVRVGKGINFYFYIMLPQDEPLSFAPTAKAVSRCLRLAVGKGWRESSFPLPTIILDINSLKSLRKVSISEQGAKGRCLDGWWGRLSGS